jgi:hypothetical protein
MTFRIFGSGLPEFGFENRAAMSHIMTPTHLVWPWQVWRFWRTQLRDMTVRHARERAALCAWIIEVEHELKDGES